EAIESWKLLFADLEAPKQPTAADGRTALRALRAVLDDEQPQTEWVEEAIGNVLKAGVSPTDERLLRLLSAQLHLVPQTTKFRTIRRAVRALNEPEDEAVESPLEP